MSVLLSREQKKLPGKCFQYFYAPSYFAQHVLWQFCLVVRITSIAI
jgi:hypothetical protein